MLEKYEQHSKIKLSATITIIMAVVLIVILADHARSKNLNAANQQDSASQIATTNTNNKPLARSNDSSQQAQSTSSLKDGSYQATSSYFVPNGSEDIKVNLTLKNGVVNDVAVINSENDFTSASYQEDFVSAYKNFVVGKKITDLQLNIISGASDTTRGFNDALSQIAAQAQS